MSGLPGLHWHCWVGPPAPPQRGGGKHLGATGWGSPGSHLFSLTASQAGWEGPSQPRGPGTPGSHVPAGWEAESGGTPGSRTLRSCWVGGWVRLERGSSVCQSPALLGGPLLAPWPERQFCWEFKSAHWCLQVAGVVSSKSGVAMGTRSHTILGSQLFCHPLLYPLPKPSRCAVLRHLGFSVGLKGRGRTCPLTSHHMSPSACFESSSQPERAGCLDGSCGCLQDWSFESLSSKSFLTQPLCFPNAPPFQTQHSHCTRLLRAPIPHPR